MFTTSLDCSKFILGFYLDCLSLCNTICDACTMASDRVMHFSECFPIGQTSHDWIFSQKANATGLWITYRITDYTVPPGEGTECCPVPGPQGTPLFRNLSFLSVKGRGPDTNWCACCLGMPEEHHRLNELSSEGQKSKVRLWSGPFSI